MDACSAAGACWCRCSQWSPRSALATSRKKRFRAKLQADAGQFGLAAFQANPVKGADTESGEPACASGASLPHQALARA